jgi:hypothetical protein
MARLPSVKAAGRAATTHRYSAHGASWRLSLRLHPGPGAADDAPGRHDGPFLRMLVLPLPRHTHRFGPRGTRRASGVGLVSGGEVSFRLSHRRLSAVPPMRCLRRSRLRNTERSPRRDQHALPERSGRIRSGACADGPRRRNRGGAARTARGELDAGGAARWWGRVGDVTCNAASRSHQRGLAHRHELHHVRPTPQRGLAGGGEAVLTAPRPLEPTIDVS